MQIHQIKGPSMRVALERARSAHGANAVVITHTSEKDGAVALAVSEAVPHTLADLAALRNEARLLLAGGQQAKRAGSAPESGTAPETETAPETGTTVDRKRPGMGDVERCLARGGMSRELMDQILAAVAVRSPEDVHPLDLAAEEIGKLFPIASAKRARGRTSILAFTGKSGVGKTTTIAKLAARFARAGRKVALATLDAYRIGAVEQLRAYATIIGAPLYVLRDSAQLLTELARGDGPDLVLLDTTGRLERDVEQLVRLREVLSATESDARLDTYLVASAVNSRASQLEAAEAVGALELAGAMITKLDETHVPAPVLEFTRERGLPIAFLCDGPDLEPHFTRPTPDSFADLLMRGRLA